MIDVEKLRCYARVIHEVATEHGWHEKEQSDETYMCLVMTEVAEAVEADRKGLYGRTNEFKKVFEENAIKHSDAWFKDWYKQEVKPTREAEMADIVIRLLDFAYEMYGEGMVWGGLDYASPWEHTTFSENAWDLVSNDLTPDEGDVNYCVCYVYAWAEQLGFDLDWHIERKIEYNRMRSYHHGGKAY